MLWHSVVFIVWSVTYGMALFIGCWT